MFSLLDLFKTDFFLKSLSVLPEAKLSQTSTENSQTINPHHFHPAAFKPQTTPLEESCAVNPDRYFQTRGVTQSAVHPTQEEQTQDNK